MVYLISITYKLLLSVDLAFCESYTCIKIVFGYFGVFLEWFGCFGGDSIDRTIIETIVISSTSGTQNG